MNLNETIIRRFFSGTYSRKEFIQVKAWFENPELRVKMKDYIHRHWLEYSNEQLPDGNFDHLLYKIQNQIKFEEKIPAQNRFIEIFQRVSAILIIPVVLAFMAVSYFQPNKKIPGEAYAEIQCPQGVRTKFELPDGSTGYLNSGSTLRFPILFSGGRQVTLAGEAFFDVKHVQNKPFTVATPNLEIEVLGTQFDVIAYKGETSEEVILQNGNVKILTSQEKSLAELNPNQKLTLDTETRIFSRNAVEASQYVGWKEGKLIFRNENMQQVAARLGRWYNIEIEIKDEELLNYAFRATFIDEPLEEVLKLLALTAPLKYKEQVRETMDDHTYKKRKVIISLDRKRLKAF